MRQPAGTVALHRPAALAIVLATLLSGCAGDGPRPAPDVASPEPAVRWLAIGDMGTGEEGQMRVAAGMHRVCESQGCDFVIGLGDNIYEAGVTSPYDPQFLLKFEQPYADFAIPFHMVLGNHDNGGVRSLHATGDLQVQYAARTDRAMDLWHMPGRWYVHEHGPVRFLALDTNIVFSSQSEVPGLADVLSQDPDGARQLAWLEEHLATAATAATAGEPTDPDANGNGKTERHGIHPGRSIVEPAGARPWTILHGHHPLFSNGEHGDADQESAPLHAWLLEAVCSGGVDALVTGHDHDLQYLGAQPDCGATEFVVSGAAAQTRPIGGTPREPIYACGSTLGFAWMQVQGERLTTRFHDADGARLFERVLDRADPSASTGIEHTRPASCTS